MSGIRTYLQLARAPALPTAVSNIAAAHLIVTGGQVDWTALAILSMASCALLAGGMVLNDCFDYDVDARERPARPLPSGRVAKVTAWSLGLGLLAAGVALAGSAGLRSLAAAAAVVAAILLYDGLLKSTWLGPLVMGSCRYLNWVLGMSIVALAPRAWWLPLPILLYIGAVTLLSRAEAGGTDRRPIVASGAALMLAAISFAALVLTGVLTEVWVLLPAALGLAAAVALVVRSYRYFSPSTVQAGVGTLILGVIPLDALMVLASGIGWGAALLLLMIPSRLLGRRLYVT